MNEIIGFPYDSELQDGKYDRAVSSIVFRKLFKKYFTNGVFPNPSTQFQVFSSNGLNILVKAGSANVDGVFAQMEIDGSLSIETASSQPRIDRVVLRHDDSREVRKPTILVKKGTPSINPQAPALERTETVYELCLAEIKIGAGVTSISQSNITDTRLKTDLCGVVTSTITSIDTSTFFEQMNDDFYTWFETIKDVLGEDVSVNLLNLINQNKQSIVEVKDDVQSLLDNDLLYVVGTDDPTIDNCPNGYFYFQIEE